MILRLKKTLFITIPHHYQPATTLFYKKKIMNHNDNNKTLKAELTKMKENYKNLKLKLKIEELEDEWKK